MIRLGDTVVVRTMDEIKQYGHHEISRNGEVRLYAGFDDDDLSCFDNTTEHKVTAVVKERYQSDESVFINLDNLWFCLFDNDVRVISRSTENVYDIDDKIIIINDRRGDGKYIGQTGLVRGCKMYAADSIEYEIDRDCDSGTSFLLNGDIKPYEDGYIPPELPITHSCSRCGASYTTTSREDIPYVDLNLCPECRRRRFITPYHRYDPELKFFSASEESDNNLYYGIELEIDNGGEYDSKAAKVVDWFCDDNDKSFVHCSHDGSLNNGFEIITQPATLKYHKNLRDKYAGIFRELIRDGYRSHNTTTCGLHVHFSRDFYADNEKENMAKLLYLVEKFWDDFVIFSRRDYRTLERYAKKMDSSTEEFIERWNKEDLHDGHYYSVNITNPNTIELRMFRGTLNIKTFMATLDFVNSVVVAAKENSLEDLQSMEFESLLGTESLDYYLSRVKANEYESEG